MTAQEQREAILSVLEMAKKANDLRNAKAGHEVAHGYRFLPELEDAIIKIRGHQRDYDEIIRRMEKQGYIKLGTGNWRTYKILRTK